MTSWKELLKELNLTIKDFAELYEIPYNTVRQWYNSSRQAPPYIKKMIEKIIELNTKGRQLNFIEEKNIENEYLVKIIHEPTKTLVHSSIINYKELLEYEKSYWYVEYVINKKEKGYKAEYYMLKKI